MAISILLQYKQLKHNIYYPGINFESMVFIHYNFTIRIQYMIILRLHSLFIWIFIIKSLEEFPRTFAQNKMQTDLN